ncbi:copper resistance protein CopC [Cellulomonas sp. H30R-01]|uniref:copper resistance CopC family protein n=1 Tax=Cellulomonas sp. H30R-01 TaxID=2704467 RepID=UPI00138BDB77|nr:copper resistance CopC family protein [Cellulomonas sp. H30R-01]QHT57725.1 copper resistance protein CopC [Cellulomonas sp. H30R-01]
MLDDMLRTAARRAAPPSLHARTEGRGSRGVRGATAAAIGRVVAAAGVVGALALLGAPAAQAHNTLRASDPADGATVAFAPDRVTLTFDMPATAIGTEVVVTAADGRVVSAGPAELVDATVAQPLAGELPAGAYAVAWRVTSADGHPIEGSLGFTATAATVAGTGGAPVPAPEPTADAASPSPATTSSASSAPTADPTPSAVPDAGDSAADEPAVAGPVLIGVGAVLVIAGGVAAWYLLRRRPDEAGGPGAGTRAPGGDPAGPTA